MKARHLLLLTAVLAFCAVACKGKQAVQTPAENPETPVEADAADTPGTPVEADAETPAEPAATVEMPNTYDIETTMGTIRIRLYDDTPYHRDNFAKLVREKYFDDILFHRVISGFMIQTGDPFTRDTLVERWGSGGPDYTIPAEILPNHSHKKGAVAAARLGDYANPMKESSGSQFYIVLDERGCRHLDGEYSVFGETVDGLDVVERIGAVRTDPYDRPLNPVRIISVKPVGFVPETD